MSDADHMRHALSLAARPLGQVAPNPAVGCVIVGANSNVIGRGWTQPGGRPHAETVALTCAGGGARGATAYVTLEPCAHLGQTPPCADALIAAGVARVVAAVEDPDPRVRGKGFARLRTAGVEVFVGVLQEEATRLNAGFFLRIEKDRPLVTVKIAQSADDKTIPPPGTNRWITGEQARRFAHLLRAQHDAVLIGVGTAIADDPELTCRLPGLENRSPIRIVLDTHLRLPVSAKLVRTARRIPTIVFTTRGGGHHLQEHGVEVLRVMHNAGGGLALEAVLGVLAGRGCTRILVEGGPAVWSAFLRERLADRLEVFTAPAVLGEGAGGDVPVLADQISTGKFERTGRRMFGPDLLESYAATA
jgi:diaminohydroxyphosphoribosylaminopyrimidine deaminase/5-amino-6-(5-phosphoribosylamino)uracil reductase